MHDVNIVMFWRFTPIAYPMKKNKLLLVPLIMFHYVENATKHTYATLKNRFHLFHNNYSYCYEVYTYYLFFLEKRITNAFLFATILQLCYIEFRMHDSTIVILI